MSGHRVDKMAEATGKEIGGMFFVARVYAIQ
jgi:hypothetical protein